MQQNEYKACIRESQGEQIPCGEDPLHWRLDPKLRRASSPPSPSHPPAMGRANLPQPTVGSKPNVAIQDVVNEQVSLGYGGSGDKEPALPGLEEVAALASRTPEKVLVTGGGGYFGFRLGRELVSRGMTVILLDIQKPPMDIPDGATFYENDIRDYDSLYRVCEGVGCIFHTASYGMSGPEQLRKELVESINVRGTNNIINVCKERAIRRLVYTSTINVVFTGKAIEDGDEDSVPPVPLHMYVDHYSRTKSIADQMVRAANGSLLEGGGHLQSCVLRSSGIFGPGEKRHLHRVLENVKRGLCNFTFGEAQAKINWVHVDNLVQAHVLAAEALTSEKHGIASGQTYFINDGVSVNVFDGLKPMFKRYGQRKPFIRVPVTLVYLLAIILEYLHVALRPVAEIPLLLTRNEVRNVAVSQTFKIDKARRELGFCPKKYDFADFVEQFTKSQPLNANNLSLYWMPSLPHVLALLLVLGLSLVLLLLY